MRAPIDQEGDAHPFAIKLTLPDGILLALSLAFILISIVALLVEYGSPHPYVVLRSLHFQLSRYGFFVGLVMLGLAVYIGLIKHGDVTPWFRRGTYVVFGTMLLQALIGAVMMFGYGIQPGAPEHIIYGFGTALTLPFFIFVEVTAKKRPAMGSYIWGFALLIGVMFRAISTGPIA